MCWFEKVKDQPGLLRANRLLFCGFPPGQTRGRCRGAGRPGLRRPRRARRDGAQPQRTSGSRSEPPGYRLPATATSYRLLPTYL